MKFDLFLKKELKKVLADRNKTKTFKSFESINTILLLFNKEDWEEIKKIISLLKKEKKTVIAWTVRPKMGKEEFEEKQSKQYPDNVHFININTDVTWKQTLNEGVIDKFTNQEYDTCLDLTTHPDLHLLYLLAKNDSQFSVGIRESEYKLYDFIIFKKEEATLLDTYHQIKYYLDKVELKHK